MWTERLDVHRSGIDMNPFLGGTLNNAQKKGPQNAATAKRGDISTVEREHVP